MKLQELRLQNFRQHRDSQLAFGSGLLALMGPNGAGKSTVIEAIGYALYGSKAIRGKLEDVRTRSIPKEERTHVELSFEHDGNMYRVERSLGDAAIYFGGEANALVTGARDVSAKVAQILGLDFEEFSAAFLTQQKGLEFLSAHKGATEREKFVVRMLGYDRIEKAQALLREDRRDLKQEILGRESGLGNEDALQNEIEVHSQAMASQAKELCEADEVLKRTETALQLAKSNYETLEGKREGYEHARKALGELEVRFEERSQTINRLDTRRRELLEANPSLREESDNQRTLEKLREDEERFAEEIRVQSALLKDEDAKWTRSKAAIQAELKQTDLRIAELGAEIKEHQRLKDGAACPTCGQEIGADAKKVTDALREKLSVLQESREALVLQHKKALSEPESISSIRAKVLVLEDRARTLKLELKKLFENGSLFEELKRLVETLAVLRNEIVELDKRMRSERSSLHALEFDPEQYRACKGKYDAANALVSVARLQRVKLQGQLNSVSALLERAKVALVELKGRKAELAKSKQRVVELDEHDEILTNFRKYLNNAIRPRLSELASEFLTDLSDGRYTTVEVNEDFTASIVDERGARSVISGGEEDLLALCMRLSLSQMLLERSGQSLSLLMLDEIFGSLDHIRRVNVLTLLEKLGNRFEQIIVITHFDDLKDAVQDAIFIEYDEATGYSSVAQADLSEVYSAINI